jgi:exosortase O
MPINSSTAQQLDAQLEGISDRSLGLAISVITIGSWLCANIASLQWLFDALVRTSVLNLLPIGGIAIGLTILVVMRHTQLDIARTPIMRAGPLGLMLGAAISAIALRWFIDLDQIGVLLFLLGSYGLLGLFISPPRWRQGLSIAAIAACIIPFSLQFTSGLGFSVRVLTAHIVEFLLSMGHNTAISSSDIIVLENGIAHVDLPCSGLRSLWFGTLFLLLTTWLEKRQFGFRWLLVYATCLLLLVAANIGRVMLLVVANFVLRQPQIVEILHIPAGLIGFIGACGVSWLLLRLVPQKCSKVSASLQIENIQPQIRHDRRRSLVSNAILIICLIGLALLPRPGVTAIAPLAPSNIHWPTQMQIRSLPLTETELDFFNSQPTTKVEKQHFEFGLLSGSMLVVSSTSWRAHHSPELCFVGNGFQVNQMTQVSLAPDFPVRWLSLQDETMSATYWFQSSTQTTDEFLSRIWSDLSRQNRSWVMVSILFDRVQTPDLPEVNVFATSIRQAIARALQQ